MRGKKMTTRQQSIIRLLAMGTVLFGLGLGALFWRLAAPYTVSEVPDRAPITSLHTLMAELAYGAPALALAGLMLFVAHALPWKKGIALILSIWLLTMGAMTAIGVAYVREMATPMHGWMSISIFKTAPIVGFGIVLFGLVLGLILRVSAIPATSAGGAPPRT